MKKDFRLGFPPAAVRSANAGREDMFSFFDERPYPLGIPQRVFEATQHRLQSLDEAEDAEAGTLAWFEKGDHKEDGAIAEGVSDAEIIRDVRTLSMRLETRRAVFEYFQALTERLERTRTRSLVDVIRKLWAQRTEEVRREEKRREAEKARAPQGLPAYVPPAALPPVLDPDRWVHRPIFSGFVTTAPATDFLGMNRTLRDKLENEREQAVNAYLDQKRGALGA